MKNNKSDKMQWFLCRFKIGLINKMIILRTLHINNIYNSIRIYPCTVKKSYFFFRCFFFQPTYLKYIVIVLSTKLSRHPKIRRRTNIKIDDKWKNKPNNKMIGKKRKCNPSKKQVGIFVVISFTCCSRGKLEWGLRRTSCLYCWKRPWDRST